MDKNKVMKEIANLAGFESIDTLKQYVAKNGYREEYWMGGIVDALKIIESQQEDLSHTPVQPQRSHYKPSFINRRRERCRV